MEKNQHARPLKIPSRFDAWVDIIVPFHGQYERVTSLLESMYRYTRTNYFTLTLVDDCSPNSSYLQTITQNVTKSAALHSPSSVFQAIRSPEHKGFAAACKLGFESTSSPYVCFLNSDCEIADPLWLRSMGETLLDLKSHGVRMVSPMTNNAVGGDPAQTGEKFFRSQEHVILESGAWLSMFCFLCHRDLFKHCGGFLREYPYGGYEDQEFAYRMGKNGFRQAVCRNAWVYHEGELTFRSIMKNNPKVVDEMKENYIRCHQDMLAC